jgi:hypothetical protein
VNFLTVRALPPSFDAEYVRRVGENIFCDEWDASLFMRTRSKETCSGNAEVEIACHNIRHETKWRLLLCREHAGYLATQLAEAIELADGGDILRASKT